MLFWNLREIIYHNVYSVEVSKFTLNSMTEYRVFHRMKRRFRNLILKFWLRLFICLSIFSFFYIKNGFNMFVCVSVALIVIVIHGFVSLNRLQNCYFYEYEKVQKLYFKAYKIIFFSKEKLKTCPASCMRISGFPLVNSIPNANILPKRSLLVLFTP